MKMIYQLSRAIVLLTSLLGSEAMAQEANLRPCEIKGLTDQDWEDFCKERPHHDRSPGLACCPAYASGDFHDICRLTPQSKGVPSGEIEDNYKSCVEKNIQCIPPVKACQNRNKYIGS